MSADNGIYILSTKDKERKDDKGMIILGEFIAFRVAHAQAIENLDWYMDEQLHNLGWYMHKVWGKSPVFYSAKEANTYAEKLLSKMNEDMEEYGGIILEYGIVQLPLLPLNFPGY